MERNTSTGNLIVGCMDILDLEVERALGGRAAILAQNDGGRACGWGRSRWFGIDRDGIPDLGIGPERTKGGYYGANGQSRA